MSNDDPPTSGQTLRHFVDSVIEKAAQYPTERRRAARQRVTIEVRAQPVDGTFTPVGDTFTAITRDISATGISLLHTRAVTDKFLQLEVATGADELSSVLEVVYCQRLGPFYEIGGRFVTPEGT